MGEVQSIRRTLLGLVFLLVAMELQFFLGQRKMERAAGANKLYANWWLPFSSFFLTIRFNLLKSRITLRAELLIHVISY